MINKKAIIKWLVVTLWVSVGIGTIVLLVAAIQKKDAQHCSNVIINVKGVSNNFFVDKKDIINSITAIVGGNPIGRPVSKFNLRTIESDLKKNVWVKTAQLFFDNNQVLQVDIFEREPMARVFTTTGTTFYIDSSVAVLPLSDKYSARLPVFTNFPSGSNKVLSKADSALLRDVLAISTTLQKDSFCMAMIDQVDITLQRTFQLIPKIGTQLIVFGDASDVEEKLQKLKLFYKDAMVKAGWNYYSEINVQYKNQVVAKRRGAEDVAADSLRTLQLMQLIASNAEKQSADSMQLMLPDNDRNSTNIDLIQQSVEREEKNEGGAVMDDASAAKNTGVNAVAKENKQTTVPKPVVATANKPVVKKQAPVKKAVVKPVSKTQAKPVAPKKPPAKANNDY
ncbi:hypothetical protein LK994_02235 [Ferruginibacter lapsinanis]|uniref:hypothetical protein n=1 Tax=Ferruginibacter lapsinanis TaxID=563172 RepID=UPI001E61529C|nr:hypothetical protein [Ferruginibacter lapsinanis]UEG50292.1 hypothetical protein LK994_02235 [Ferruginibacter lapsinanis]